MSQSTYLKNNQGDVVAHATLHGFAGNRTIAVLGDVSVSESEQGKGFGKRIVKQAMDVAKTDGKLILLATVLERNAPMVHIMETLDWKKLSSFRSAASGLQCGLWFKSL